MLFGFTNLAYELNFSTTTLSLWKVLFCRFGLVVSFWKVQFSRFGLLCLVSWVWFAMFGLVWFGCFGGFALVW